MLQSQVPITSIPNTHDLSSPTHMSFSLKLFYNLGYKSKGYILSKCQHHISTANILNKLIYR